MRRFTRLAALIIGVSLVGAAALPVLGAGGNDKPLARNVILLVDDGGGYNHHEVGSLYDTGLRDGEAYNDFPFQFGVSTYSRGYAAVGACPDPIGYDPTAAWASFAAVMDPWTDSAAAATAMSTGVKSFNGAVGVDCMGVPQEHFLQTVETLGKSTGILTSVPWPHATPASFVAHNIDRNAYQQITNEMLFDSRTDVVMGGGHPYWTPQGRKTVTPSWRYISAEDWLKLTTGQAAGQADTDPELETWTYIETRADFQALMTGDTPERVWGVGQIRRTLQYDRAGDLTAAPFAVPFSETIPSLPEMTLGALNVLDNDPEGFFLMVEGGATDWAAGDGVFGRMVEEELSFDRTVDAVLAWVDQHSNWGETLVIVTSDHETAYVTGPGSGETPDGPVWNPVVDNGQGVQPGFVYNAPAHTNSLIPLYAKGDAGRLLRAMVDGTDPVRGEYIDNTDIHALLLAAVGATP